MNSLVGRVYGEYRLESLIGRGNLGDTFRAQHVRTARSVVLKVLHPRLTTDSKFRDRFQQIVGTAQGLRHPNVVAIEHFGDTGGMFFVAMEAFPDGSLRTLLQRRAERLPLARAVNLVRQAADALAFAHARSVVHRDMKPENVLITRNGADADLAKVADFGFTRLSEGGLTMGGNEVFGSLPYMSPEQCRWAAVDARTDIYSLGVVLYEAVTGLVPFQVTTLKDAMEKHISAPPPPPRSVAPQLPAELEAIILRCLAKSPGDRFSSAGELSSALERLGLGAWPQVRLADSERPVIKLQDTAPVVRLEGDVPAGPIVRLRDDKPVVTPPVKADVAPAPPPPPERKQYVVKLGPSSAQQEAAAAAPPVSIDVTPPPRYDRGSVNVVVNPEKSPQPSRLPPDREKQPAGAARGESRRIRVALDEESLALTPGIPAVLPVSVVNVGARVDFLAVTVEGVPDKWVEIPRNPPQLNPNAGTTVPLKITVPRSSKSRAREYAVTIRARSYYDEAESSTATGRWTVLPFAAASLVVAPSRVHGWRRADTQATLTNDGNAPARYTVSGSDDERVLQYKIDEREIALEPGESKSAKIGISAPFRIIGSTETRGFSVAATPITGTAPLSAMAPQIAQGQFVQRAAVPTIVPPLVLAAAIALYALWPRATPPQVKLTPSSVVVAVGDSATVAAAVTSAKNELLPNQEVHWSSRDSTVATVLPSGVVRGRREGRTAIIAQQGRTTSEAVVDVVAAKLVAVAVSPARVSLKVGASTVLSARATDATGRSVQRAIVWTSSDPSVATVGGNGRVVAKGAGLATITAQSEQKQASAEVQVDSIVHVVVAPSGPVEDCQAYDPPTLRIANRPGPGWMLTDGSNAVLLTLDNEQDARRSLSLARRYKAHCFVGRLNKRPNRSDYVREYWKTPTGTTTQIDGEECTSYDPAAATITERGPEGFAVVSGRQLYLLTDSRTDAQQIWDLARRSSSHCLIGGRNKRENRRDFTVEYWK
jgi:serine/threonine protein kinase